MQLQPVQRLQVPQRQATAQQPQGGQAEDAGQAWLEYEKNPVGRI
jgi:hypothetical protein